MIRAKSILLKELIHRKVLFSDSPERTFEIGTETAAFVPEDGTVFLIGELGSGKTLFAKGLGSAFGIDPNEVTSPSFIIVAEHRARVPLFHIDLYRLQQEEEFEEIGLRDILAGPGVKIIEWAEKLDLPRFLCHVAVFIEDAGDDNRRLEILHTNIEG